MFSGVSALLLRALREDALLLRYHLLRGGAVLFLIVIAINSYSQRSFSAAPGRDLFSGLIGANVLLVSLAGAGYFASAIAEEKEEETLGLLLMAGVSPLGILLGKSTSRVVLTLMLGLLELPFLMLAVTLGGVTHHQIVCGFAMIAGYTLLVGNLGLLCSVIAATTSQSSRWMIGLLLCYFIIPVIPWGIPSGGQLQSITAFLKTVWESTPWSQIGAISSTGYSGHPISFQVQSNAIAGVTFFVATWLFFNSSTRDLGRGPSPQPTLPILQTLTRQKSAGSRRCIGNPFVWKDFVFLAGGLKWIVINSLLLAAGIALFAMYDLFVFGKTDFWNYFRRLQLILYCVLILHSASLASRIFSTERRDQTFPLLFLTPNSPLWITYSKLLGTFAGILPASLLSVRVWCWQIEHSPSTWRYEDSLILCVLFMNVLVYLHLVVLLSLFLKWGAAPTAVGVMFCGYFCWAVFLSPRVAPNFDSIFGILLELIVVAGILHASILARLRWLIQN